MANCLVLLADGFEEIEALTPVDLMRRVGDTVDLVSVMSDIEVRGAHDIVVRCEKRLSDLQEALVLQTYDCVLLPGGNPGYVNLRENESVKALCQAFVKEKKVVAAICAAPTVLADFGLLKEKKATCFPGMEDALIKGGASFLEEPVVWDGNILTSRGMGTAFDFGLTIIEHFHGQQKATELANIVVYRR